MTAAIDRLLALARRRGAVVRVLPDAEIRRRDANPPRGWWFCPFSLLALGVDAETRAVLIGDDGCRDPNAVSYLIHELGHLYATTDPVSDAHEFEWLGWEIAVAREVRAVNVWRATMSDYALDGVGRREVGDLNEREWRDLARDRIAHGQSIGIVDERGRAVWR